jgi:chromosome partitioning protein
VTAKVIAFYNNKGGVAKTTTATNVAGVLSLQRKKVLLIDGDPQGHTSLTFGVDADQLQATLGAFLRSGWTAEQAAQYFITVNDYLKVVPSNQSLADFIIEASSENPRTRNKHLKAFIKPVMDQYDYIIFDMAPAVDIILENIVEVVDDLVVVATPETYAVKNTETTLKITDERKVKVRHIVPTRVQIQTNTHRFMLENLKEVADSHHIGMTKTYIPNLIAFTEAVSIYQLPLALVEDKRYSSAQKYYRDLVKELGY